MVTRIPPKPLSTGNGIAGAEPSLIPQQIFPTHVNSGIWNPQRLYKTNVTPITRVANTRRIIALTKDAVVNISSVLFPIPIPTVAKVLVVDKEFHLKGDVNWDGKIDDADVTLIETAYGSSPGSPNWNPDCDLNGDGTVDIIDGAIVAENYGSRAPEYATLCDVEVVAGKCVLIATAMEQTLQETITIKTAETLFVVFVYDVPLGMFSRAVTPPIPPIELPVM